MSKRYTISRFRTITQVCTDEIEADSEKEALEIANEFQDGHSDWQDAGWVSVEYIPVITDNILEVFDPDDSDGAQNQRDCSGLHHDD
jgi:hypothetical protein